MKHTPHPPQLHSNLRSCQVYLEKMGPWTAWTDGSRWNGALNVWVSASTFSTMHTTFRAAGMDVPAAVDWLRDLHVTPDGAYVYLGDGAVCFDQTSEDAEEAASDEAR